MATSGTIKKDIRTGYRLQIAWEVLSQSVADNTSEVKVKVQLVSTGSYYTIISSLEKSGSVTINGTKYSFNFTAALSANQTKTLYTKTVTVKHSADGSKTCEMSCSIGLNVYLTDVYFGTQTAEGDAVFNTIPRATQPTLSASSVDMGSSITISMPRASSDFTHTLSYSFGSLTGTIGSGLGTSKAWTVPLDFVNAVITAASGTCTLTCSTYNGSTLIGTKTVSFTANVPASVVPTISAVAVTETVSGLAAKFSGFVQNKSKLNIAITAAGASGSTITAYKTTVDGKSYTGASATTSAITSSGSVAITVTVTDSRGRTATTTKNITVIAYSPVVVKTLVAGRCTSDGTSSAEGTYLSAKIGFTIAPVGNLNTNTYVLQYRQSGASSWTTLLSGSGYSMDATKVSTSAVLAADNNYEVQLTVTDYFGSVTSNVVNIGTAYTLLDFKASGKGVAIGKIADRENALEVAMQTKTTGGQWVHSSRGISGTAGHVKLATILVNQTYCNSPIKMTIAQRKMTRPAELSILFSSVDSKDPSVNTFTYTGGAVNAYLVKSATSTWDLYVTKSESYDVIGVTEFSMNFEHLPAVTISWIKDTQVDTLPTGYVQATPAIFRISVTASINENRLTDMDYICEYYPHLGMVFFRMFGTINTALSVGAIYTLVKVDANYKPKYNHPLSAYSTKNISSNVSSGGNINVRPFESVSVGDTVNLAGFWFI